MYIVYYIENYVYRVNDVIFIIYRIFIMRFLMRINNYLQYNIISYLNFCKFISDDNNSLSQNLNFNDCYNQYRGIPFYILINGIHI